MSKYNVPLEWIQNLVKIVKSNINSADIDYVVGVARGGLIPAVWISHALNKPLLTVNLQSYKETKQDEMVWLQKFDTDIIANKNLLVVDDICDTGNTFKEIANVCSNANSIKFASIVQKIRDGKFECYTSLSDYLFEDIWYVFPWEIV